MEFDKKMRKGAKIDVKDKEMAGFYYLSEARKARREGDEDLYKKQLGLASAALKTATKEQKNNPFAAVKPLLECLTRDSQLVNPVGDYRFDTAASEHVALPKRSQDPVERHTDTTQIQRQFQHFAVLPVPENELHVLVKNSKALSHLMKR